ncbi:hypothetical protein P7K49_014974, partial [Saguinus oedipus]
FYPLQGELPGETGNHSVPPSESCPDMPTSTPHTGVGDTAAHGCLLLVLCQFPISAKTQAPVSVWTSQNLFCVLQLHGHTGKVSNLLLFRKRSASSSQ